MKKQIVYLILGIILLIIFSWSYFSYVNGGVIYSLVTSDIDSIVSYIEGFGMIAGLIFVLITAMEVIIAPIPPLVLYIAGGIIFGTFLGGVLASVGNIIGSIIAFLIARKLGRHYIEKRIDKKSREKFDKFSEKYGGFSIFLLRINPLTSSDIFSYIAGLTKIKLSSFIIGTVLGLAPLIFLQTYIGSDIVRSNPFLYLVFIWVSIAYLIIFLYGLWWFNKRKK